jgi:hypothetical protein
LSGQNLSGSYLGDATLANADLSRANLTNTSFSEATLLDADLTGADTRGSWRLNLAGAISRNAILPDGKIAGLVLAAGERALVRDDDGVSDPAAQWWLTPRLPIAVAIHDQATISEGSVLQLVFDADPWGSPISFESGIPVQLGGDLELTFADKVDVASQIGRTMRIFDWTGVSPSGEFEVRSPYVWDTTNLYTTGEVTLVAVPEPSAALLLLIGGIALTVCRRSPRGHSVKWHHADSPARSIFLLKLCYDLC